MHPRLSIVVPFFNVERYIGDCLDSLARQTFTDFEVILVDDGSRDASVEVAREYCAKDDRFRLVTQENQGLGSARNTGVRHAQGDYLTFVDSDDLVPRHAYQIMVRSLDETASSLAAGNARRFNNTAGVRQSYVHRLPFATDRRATHLFDHPTLSIDRMVWNKVYRRTFWDQFGYEFPAIRYEDYPVTLRAHIDAVTVDCIAAPVYYWRERESGESITQLKFQFANLADRVTSAEMVFDLVDAKAPELRGHVHRHLAEIDLATVVQAFAEADDDELPALLGLGRRLADRLDPAVLAAAATFQRLEYEALRAGDTDLLRRLGRFRADGGLRGGVRAERHPTMRWRFEGQYPGLRSSTLPADFYRLPKKELNVRTSVLEQRWDADALVLHGTAEIAHLPMTPESSVRAELAWGRQSRPLPVERVTDREFVTRVPRTLLGSLPAWVTSATVRIEVRAEGLRRQGALAPGGLQYPTGARVGDAWVQPVRNPNGRLTLQFRRNAAELTGAAVAGDDLVLTGRLPASAGPNLRLTRSAGDITVPLHRSGGDFTARVPLDDLTDESEPDDPFLGRTVLVPRVDDQLLLITGLDRGVFAARRGRVVTVSRSPGMYLNLVEGPARVTADDAAVTAEGGVTVAGPRWPGVDYEGIVWRRFLPNSDTGIDAPTRVELTDDRWRATVSPAGLDLANWTLFAGSYAVQTDAFMLSRLPVVADRFFLRPRAGILHLETD